MSSKRLIPLSLLADPVRRRVIEHLDRQASADVDALAAAVGVHLNTVRSHIAALESAGVVTREAVSEGRRGRPRLLYRIAEGWRLPGTDYQGLAELFAHGLSTLNPTAEQIDRLGREWGQYLAGRPGIKSAGDLIEPALTSMGFEVEIDETVVRLSGCPCRLVLPSRPEVVCQLAAAVVAGLASVSRQRMTVQTAAHDLVARRCELHLAAA